MIRLLDFLYVLKNTETSNINMNYLIEGKWGTFNSNIWKFLNDNN